MGVDPPHWLARAADGSDEYRRWCSEAMLAYLRHDEDGWPDYTGSHFASLGPNPPNEISAVDLIAVSTLSVHVPRRAALRFLERDHESITKLLIEVGPDVDLHTVDEDRIDRHSCAEELWRLLRSKPGVPGTGPVTTSKILARKRPRLLPIWDISVGKTLGLRDSRDHWTTVHCMLAQNPAYVAVLDEARPSGWSTDELPVLRILDVLLWMSDGRRDPPT